MTRRWLYPGIIEFVCAGPFALFAVLAGVLWLLTIVLPLDKTLIESTMILMVPLIAAILIIILLFFYGGSRFVPDQQQPGILHKFSYFRFIALIIVLFFSWNVATTWYMDTLPIDRTLDGLCEICGKEAAYTLNIRAGDEVIETHEYCKYHTYCLAFLEPLTVAPVALESLDTYITRDRSSDWYRGSGWKEWDWYSMGQYLVFFNLYGFSCWLGILGAFTYLSRCRPAAVEYIA